MLARLVQPSRGGRGDLRAPVRRRSRAAGRGWGRRSWGRTDSRTSAAMAAVMLEEVKEAAAAVGAWVEPKGAAVAVHFRGLSDPEAARDRVRGPPGRDRRDPRSRDRAREADPRAGTRWTAAQGRRGRADRPGSASSSGVVFAGRRRRVTSTRSRRSVGSGPEGSGPVRSRPRGPETPAEVLAAVDLLVDGTGRDRDPARVDRRGVGARPDPRPRGSATAPRRSRGAVRPARSRACARAPTAGVRARVACAPHRASRAPRGSRPPSPRGRRG